MLLGSGELCGCRLLTSLEAFGLSCCLLGLVKIGWNAVIVSHFLSNLHHVQILQAWAILNAELEVALLVCYWIPIKGKLRELMCILN